MNQFESETKFFWKNLRMGLTIFQGNEVFQSSKPFAFSTVNDSAIGSRIRKRGLCITLLQTSFQERIGSKKPTLHLTLFSINGLLNRKYTKLQPNFYSNGFWRVTTQHCFCDGATSSGKTFTMIGGSQEVGLMPRALQSLFNFSLQDRYKETMFKASYAEIYNENIRDLLTTEGKNLEIREDKNNGITIAGVIEVDVKTVPEVLALLKVGNKNLSKESTDANKEFSRPNAILQQYVECKDKAAGLTDQIIQSKISLVDLAGSERAVNTNNKGLKIMEGASINMSFITLLLLLLFPFIKFRIS